MDPVAKSTNYPPKKGLTKVQQNISSQNVTQDNCPCANICKKIGTFKQGACYLGTSDTHKCLVANNLLLARSFKFE